MVRRYYLSLRVDSGTLQSIINTSGFRRFCQKTLSWCFSLLILLPLCPELRDVKMVLKDLTVNGLVLMVSGGTVKTASLIIGLMPRLETLMSIENVMIN